jgi:hypothetical protein
MKISVKKFSLWNVTGGLYGLTCEQGSQASAGNKLIAKKLNYF